MITNTYSSAGASPESIKIRRRHDSKEDKIMISEDHKYTSNRRCPTRRLIIALLTILAFVLFAVYADLLPIFLNSHSKINYVIIIDAGSTGSRAHVFTLQQQGSGYKLVKDDFLPLKPGLSSFGSDAKAAAQSLKPLLEYASSKVPKNRHKDCPIEVKATAGLRILSEQVANNILKEVELFIEQNYDFQKSAKKVAEIMDGTDEGIFAWISLNYFLDNFKPVPMTTAALDLGGGSFQLTFETHSYSNLPENAKENVVTLNLAGLERKIYVKSYLGMGLKEARIRVLKATQTEGSAKLTSSCLPEKYSGSWEHGGNNYEVMGTEASGYENCLAQMKQVFDGEITVISELYGKELYAFSYVYDKAKDSNLIRDVTGAAVTVSDFVKIAKEACAAQLVNQRFQCLDTVYINYLFVHAFNLSQEYKVNVVKKVNGEEISWALGAAFHVLDHTA